MTAHAADVLDVLVVGGGVVGTSLALALGRQGRRVALLEKAMPVPFDPDGETDLRVFAINRASQRLFETLGVWQDMVSLGVSPYESMEVWDARSPGRIRFEAGRVGEPDLGHIIESRVIQWALWTALDAAGVQRLCPATLARLETGSESVHVIMGDGQAVRARLVVGADGARSRVRAFAGIGVDARDYGQKAVVANVTTAHHNQATAWQRFLPTGPLAFLPLSDGRSSIVWSVPGDMADALLGLGDAAFCRELEAAFEWRLGAVTATSDRTAFVLAGSQAMRYVRPRIALVGDAAHTVHPLAGQGANLGLADVAALVDVLASHGDRDPGDGRGLRAYERRRRGENWMMMRAMEGFSTLFGSRHAAVELFRGVGLTLADRLPGVKHAFLRRALEGD